MEGSEGTGRAVGTQAISRAFAVLHLVRDHGAELGVGQIAKELQLNLSTAHRIVRALVGEGYLAQNETNERYYLGTGALLLGQAASRNFRLDVVHPVLARLAERTGESVNLGVLNGTYAVVVERIESPQPLRFTQPPGTRAPLHASAMGKALLAFNEHLEASYLASADHLVGIHPNTHTTEGGLRDDLAATRARGWSTDDEESYLAVRCVGAPIQDGPGHSRAAIAVQAPALRMPPERFAEVGPEVVRAAKEIAALLPPGHAF
ncbi:IclR family transcriptional regulator [Amycolatopsis alkalitolerans]|uniref:Glycerol operon regulatory protein n=2 Tax=Amycolatopsis alkalitolerans TaxID=2547244 RepID=A0A5C4M0D9_9PSEU|nr:IclR family transcriptional regulator [Amycolatopsis alkalitolerans]